MDIPFLRIGDSLVTLSSILPLVASLAIAILIAIVCRQILVRFLLERLGLRQGNRESIAIITGYAIGAFSFILMLQVVGVNVSSLAVIAGSLGIGIGFGLQDMTRNFISGLMLLIEGKIKVGDFIEWQGLTGYVTEVSLRATVLRTFTHRHIVIPNSSLISDHVINWTYHNTKGWAMIPVHVTHESDPVLVIEALLDSAYTEETVSFEKPAEAYFTKFSDYALEFVLWVWVTRIDLKYKTESSLHFIIEQNLRQRGIQFASPRLDVWQRNPNVLITSSPEHYPHHSELQQPRHHFIDPLTKPIPVRDLLRQVSYFENCTELELRKLVEVGYRRRLETDEILYREGDAGDAFYIILLGSVGYVVTGLDQPPTVLEAGQFIGEFSLMLGIARTVTVRAMEDTTIFAINPQGFNQLLQSQPRLYEVIVQQMGKHEEELSLQQRRLRELGLLNPSEYNQNPVQWVKGQLDKLFNA
ncbi:mechanosensitive ion channel domain-containing protein [Spirulina major]|uniref:mechanosensitive ion channel domain-containing protein n=1 Tax=Spirulina major TaxID=270636 RepID=UPI001C31B784|nr:mechanosensitive ion channel domain-containing protein [Spirulina major]